MKLRTQQDKWLRRCRHCKKAPWICRSCGRKCCEHYCGFKTNDGKATCSACNRKSLGL